MTVNIEARQLGNGVDTLVDQRKNTVNATLEAGENFTSQWSEGKTI